MRVSAISIEVGGGPVKLIEECVFKSIGRDTDIEEEYHNALTGHDGQGSEGREYGDIMFGCFIGRPAKSRARFRQLKSVAGSLRRSGRVGVGGFEEGEFESDSPIEEVATLVRIRGADAVQFGA